MTSRSRGHGLRQRLDVVVTSVVEKRLGALPVAAEFLRRLDVAGILDEVCPGGASARLSHGQVIEALVANRLTSPAPLVRVGDWARTWAVEEVFGIEPDLLNAAGGFEAGPGWARGVRRWRYPRPRPCLRWRRRRGQPGRRGDEGPAGDGRRAEVLDDRRFQTGVLPERHRTAGGRGGLHRAGPGRAGQGRGLCRLGPHAGTAGGLGARAGRGQAGR